MRFDLDVPEDLAAELKARKPEAVPMRRYINALLRDALAIGFTPEDLLPPTWRSVYHVEVPEVREP